MLKPSIYLKIVHQSKGKVQRVRSHKSRRIFKIIQADKYSECLFEVSVVYTKGMKNETHLLSKKEIIKTLKMFLE